MENLREKQKSTSRPEDVDRIAELEAQLVAAADDAERAKFALADVKSQLQDAQDQLRAESMRRWAEGGADEDPASSLASPKGGDVKGGRVMEVNDILLGTVCLEFVFTSTICLVDDLSDLITSFNLV